MKYFGLLLLVLILFTACTDDSIRTPKESKKAIQEISAGGSKISDIIRSPVNANEPLDTVNIAKITFQEVAYNFGTVKEGDIVNRTFNFENTGKVPLVITNVRSTCGCTIPQWPEEAIAPGEKNAVKVRFDTKNKPGNQSKTVTIIANTYPKNTEIRVAGTVMEK